MYTARNTEIREDVRVQNVCNIPSQRAAEGQNYWPGGGGGGGGGGGAGGKGRFINIVNEIHGY